VSETDECDHADLPTTCAWCDKPPVVIVNIRGACADHVDEVFGEAGTALGMMLIAACEAFGGEEPAHERE
jgi:hypothetical protein